MADDAVPPPPPQAAPPAPAVPPVPGQRNTGMLVLAYLGLLALIPLLTEKNDREVQWHAKNGLVFTAAFVVLWVGLSILSSVTFIFWFLHPVLYLVWLIVTVLGIAKAVQGQRFLIPGLSEYADKF
jgi:uncharacterized membrane protein